MSGRKLVIVAAAGFGAWWFLRRTAGVVVPSGGAAAATTIASSHDVVTTTMADPGPVVPALAPFYAAAKPIATYVTTPLIHTVNHFVGGVDPTAGLTKNADGSYTDGLGARITVNPDGTITRHNPNWKDTNGGKVIVATGHVLEKGGKAVVHFVEGLF